MGGYDRLMATHRKHRTAEDLTADSGSGNRTGASIAAGADDAFGAHIFGSAAVACATSGSNYVLGNLFADDDGSGFTLMERAFPGQGIVYHRGVSVLDVASGGSLPGLLTLQWYSTGV